MLKTQRSTPGQPHETGHGIRCAPFGALPPPLPVVTLATLATILPPDGVRAEKLRASDRQTDAFNPFSSIQSAWNNLQNTVRNAISPSQQQWLPQPGGWWSWPMSGRAASEYVPRGYYPPPTDPPSPFLINNPCSDIFSDLCSSLLENCVDYSHNPKPWMINASLVLAQRLNGTNPSQFAQRDALHWHEYAAQYIKPVSDRFRVDTEAKALAFATAAADYEGLYSCREGTRPGVCNTDRCVQEFIGASIKKGNPLSRLPAELEWQARDPPHRPQCNVRRH